MRRSVMRRYTFLRSVVAIVLLGVLALQARSVAVAQEATPGAEEMTPERVTEELVVVAPGIETTTLSDLLVFRLGLEPGAISPIDDSPGVGILLVESGTLTVEVDGEMTVTRSAGRGETMASAEATGDLSGVMEAVAVGEAVMLEAGDAAYIPGNVPGEIRNESQAPATGLAFIVFPSEGMTSEATPAP
jgi:quercetin dioxygenase-like cupin family protein